MKYASSKSSQALMSCALTKGRPPGTCILSITDSSSLIFCTLWRHLPLVSPCLCPLCPFPCTPTEGSLDWEGLQRSRPGLNGRRRLPKGNCVWHGSQAEPHQTRAPSHVMSKLCHVTYSSCIQGLITKQLTDGQHLFHHTSSYKLWK